MEILSHLVSIDLEYNFLVDLIFCLSVLGILYILNKEMLLFFISVIHKLPI